MYSFCKSPTNLNEITQGTGLLVRYFTGNLQCSCHESPVALPNSQHDFGRQALHHLNVMEDAVGYVKQGGLPVDEP